jgi:hypothetical protein
MNNYWCFPLMIATSLLLLAGCKKDESARAAAVELEKAFQTTPAATAPAAPETPNGKPRVDDVKGAIDRAVVAMKTNDYVEAFTTLRAVQAAPTITVNQYSAIESARLALERDLAAKALKGDEAARKALEKINKVH